MAESVIVLLEAGGIGEITKQIFKNVYFLNSYNNAPVMCMSKEMAMALEEKVGTVEEIVS